MIEGNKRRVEGDGQGHDVRRKGRISHKLTFFYKRCFHLKLGGDSYVIRALQR